MKLKKLLVYLLTASILLESAMPVYAGNIGSTITSENMKTVSLDETTVSTDAQKETDDFETTEEATVSEETSTESESTETEEESNESESTETEEESTESESAETEEESTESESTETEEESTEEGESTETEDSALDNSVSENDVTTTPVVKELDYILGREMTAEEIEAQKAMVPQLVPLEPMELDSDNLYAGVPVSFFSELESTYDSRNNNIITDVRNQNPWGTCWAFSAFAALESSLVQQGLASRDSIDLSERHLAYFTTNTGYDALGNASLDTITPPNEKYYLNSGGNLSRATMRLMNWQGAASEAEYPYSNTSTVPAVIAKENAQDIIATAKNVYFVPTQGASVEDETAVVKKLIKEYGCVSWSYYDDQNYEDTSYNSSTGAYYCSDSTKETNHAITIVGWDDTFSKANFNEGKQPQNDGAWIVKNSWGANWGKSGYFYISYEDATLGEGNNAGVVIAGEADEYDNNYFYSNCCYGYSGGRKKIAQVFEAKSGAEQEILSAISFMLSSDNESYEIQIYKNPETVNDVVINPESGEAMYTTPFTGETGYPGLYTIDIPKIVLQAGDTFSVVVTFTSSDGMASIYYDGSLEGGTTSRSMVNATEAGQSFWSYGNGWVDLHSENHSVRMNAFTTNVYGSVPVLRYKIAKPADFLDTQTNRIFWTECLNAKTYEIYRSESIDETYVKIGEVESGTSVYEDTLSIEQWNTTFYYKIKVVFSDESTAESEALEVPGKVTLKVSGLTVDTVSGYNEISWKPVSGATGYEIERKLSTESEYTHLITISNGQTVTYNDPLNEQGKVYEYRVRAYKDDIYSMWSDTISADNVFVELYNYGTSEQRFRVSWEKRDEFTSYIMRLTRHINGGTYWWNYSTSGSHVLVYTSHFKVDDGTPSGDTGIGDEITFEVIPLDSEKNEITPNLYKEVKLVWTPMEVLSVENEYAGGTATFTWTGAANAEFIDIYRSTDKNSHGETVFKTISTSETSFTDTGLERGDVYYYWLYTGATNSAGEKVYSKPYCYKLEVPSNAESIELELGSETANIGDEIPIVIYEIIGGEQYKYEKAITWSAKNGTKNLNIIEEDSDIKVMGSDGQEILRINDRTLVATGLSKDKSVTLTAKVGNLTDEAQITIKVPINDIEIGVIFVNEDESGVLPEQLYLGDFMLLQAQFSPENADVDEIQWTYDDSMVELTDAESEDEENVVFVGIIKVGKTKITATAKNDGESFSAELELSSILRNITINEVRALDARRLQVFWNSVYEDESYNIYRKAENETDYSLLKSNISQTTYIDDTVETGVTYEYKIQNVKDGESSSLDLAEAKAGKTLPDKAEILNKTYRSLTIKNDIFCEYAVSKENNKATAAYTSDVTGADIIFDGLEPEQTYYVFVRLIKDKTIYGENIQVTLPEKGKLILSKDEIILSKGDSYLITYTVSTGEASSEILVWTACYEEDGEKFEGRDLGNGIIAFYGEDGKEICQIVENVITATGLSSTKELYLTAKNSNDLEGSCRLLVKVPVTGISLESIAIDGETSDDISHLNVGQKASFKVSTEPDNADDSVITWKSSNDSILAISASDNGKNVVVEALDKGNCEITAEVDGVKKSWQISVTVPLTGAEVKVVSLNGKVTDALPEVLCLNDVIVLEAEYSPVNADVDEINWTCDDSMVSVESREDGTAVVKVLKSGETSITATVTGGEYSVTANIELAAISTTKIQDKTYHSLTVKNDTLCEYAVSKENDREKAEYVSDAAGADITFDNLEPKQTYYVFVRLKANNAVYGEAIQVTLPEKGKLILSKDEIKLSKGESYKVTYTVSTGEEEEEALEWSAYYEENGASCTETIENGNIVFKGKDGEEICKIVNNEIFATGLSATKELYLTAKNSSDLEGSCKIVISVPVSTFTLKDGSGEAVSDIIALNVKDKVSFNVAIEPDNADDCNLTWKSSDTGIVQLGTVSNDGKTIELEALAKGICKITAVTNNGIEKSWQIQVVNTDEVLEYWVVNEEDTLTMTDVIELAEDGYSYSLKEFDTRGCTIDLGSSDITKQLKVYGLKRKHNVEVNTFAEVEELYELREFEIEEFADELVFTSTSPAVATVGEDGKITAFGAGNTEVFVYGNNTKEKYGKYLVTVSGNAESEKEDCPIPSTVKLSPVVAKVYLEQFSHHSNSSAALEISGKDYTYDPTHFTFTSADSSVCIVDAKGVVRVNPTYSGNKDKTVKVTASVKNDPKGRKVTFNVVVYGKQQISGMEIFYADAMPDHVAMRYEKNGTITFTARAYGSNGEEINNPAVKWTVSNSAVASVKQNKDGTATVTMKKPGQCSIICTANDSWKNSDTLLLKAIDITPILDKKTVKLETKTEEKKSESFTLTSVYGTTYAEPIIESAKMGKTDYTGDVEVIKNADNSYSLIVSDFVLSQMKNNSKVVVTMSAEAQVQESVDIPKAEFSVTLQVVTKEPTVTVKEAGTINRYYNFGGNVRSLLTIKTNEKVTDVKVAEGQDNKFDEYISVIQESGQWYLELQDTEDYNSNSLKGNLLITLDGYETIEKTITVKTASKKPKLTQQATPVINVNDKSNKTAEVTVLNNKVKMNHFVVETVEAFKTNVTKLPNGNIQISLKGNVEFKNNETVSTIINVWETDEDGNKIWQTPVQLSLKVKVSTQVPKITLKQKTLTLNIDAEKEKAVTNVTWSQQNLVINAETHWNIKKYNKNSKQYNIDVEWLDADYDQESQSISLNLKPGLPQEQKPEPGSYKIRITNVISGFETVPMDVTVKVIKVSPTVSIKTGGKLDLTNKSSCSLTGKLTFKNTIANEITAVEVVDDSRFYAEVTGKNTIALSVTEEGMPEDSIQTEKQNVKLNVTLAGGTDVETTIQIKPVCTIPKMKLPAMKTLYKSVRNQTVKYDFEESLAKGVKISQLEVVSVPNQFHVDVAHNALSVSMKEKEKGVKAGIYSIKVKVVFEGASNKPQTKTVKVKVME